MTSVDEAIVVARDAVERMKQTARDHGVVLEQVNEAGGRERVSIVSSPSAAATAAVAAAMQAAKEASDAWVAATQRYRLSEAELDTVAKFASSSSSITFPAPDGTRHELTTPLLASLVAEVREYRRSQRRFPEETRYQRVARIEALGRKA